MLDLIKGRKAGLLVPVLLAGLVACSKQEEAPAPAQQAPAATASTPAAVDAAPAQAPATDGASPGSTAMPTSC